MKHNSTFRNTQRENGKLKFHRHYPLCRIIWLSQRQKLKSQTNKQKKKKIQEINMEVDVKHTAVQEQSEEVQTKQ